MTTEPLPESTLDLKAIEARKMLTYDVEDMDPRLRDDFDALIAEVKRLRGVPHPEWRHDTDPGPGIDETLCCETCGGSGHGACGIAQGTKETDRG